MIHVYALCDPPLPALGDRRGLDDRPLEGCEAGSVAAVYSVIERPHAAAPPDDLWRHESVVESLMDERAVLPARFGTRFPGAEQLVAVLSHNGRALAEGLRRVRGAVEIGVRVISRPPVGADSAAESDPPPRNGTGRAYLLARLDEERRRRARAEQAERRAEDLHRRLSVGALDATRRILATPDLLLTGAYLVRRDGIDPFRRRAEELGREHPDVRLLCTGPWPPYHFVPQIPLAEPSHA